MNTTNYHVKPLISALAAGTISVNDKNLIAALASLPGSVAIAETFGASKLIRALNLNRNKSTGLLDNQASFKNNEVFYQDQVIGQVKLLFKVPLPGELQAKLAIESAIDRFLEYLQKQYYMVVLDESDRHVRLFVPQNKISEDFKLLWNDFIGKIAFSIYGNPRLKLLGLTDTFILMLNNITLAGRGFSTLEVPILTPDQAIIIAAWYNAVIREVKKRQNTRQAQIDRLRQDPASCQSKELAKKEEMQEKEAAKYAQNFHKSFSKKLEMQKLAWQDLNIIESQLAQTDLSETKRRKLQNQQIKLQDKIDFDEASVHRKIDLLKLSGGNPFQFIQLDQEQEPEKFARIKELGEKFTKTATDQINSTRGDIFSQCIYEMYRLLENPPSDPYPEPLLTEEITLPQGRSPGDDSKEFCYSCGTALDPKTAQWKLLRFIFERPLQRCQSAPRDDSPFICTSCAALAFASPLKITDDSIVIQLETRVQKTDKLKISDYIRMLTVGETHLYAGQYLILKSDKTNTGDIAADKLGQQQYALAKVSSIFPLEVLTDFDFYLLIQGSEKIKLKNRYLLFIKGLMNGYNQSIVTSGKEINVHLGDAIRYVERDLPIMAEYKLLTKSSYTNGILLEQIRSSYLSLLGANMNSYKDVAALTGMLYAFVQSFKSVANAELIKAELIKQAETPEEVSKLVKREVSKLIEKSNDPTAFCYTFAQYCNVTNIGNDKRTFTQVRLFSNPDNYFIYEQAKELMQKLGVEIDTREKKDGQQSNITFYPDDIINAYAYFSENGYAQEKDWRDLTYQLKLSLYTRFPELVREQKSNK